MRAMAMETFGGPEVLRPMSLPDPRPERGEVRIRVVAAGVNPVDWKIREGWLEQAFPHRFPVVPGWDAAGVIEELGEGAARFRRGDRVWAYARKPVVQWGTYAECVTLPEASVARMPGKLLFEEAAAVPLAALTAYQSLFGPAAVGPATTVLVHAAAGGVGHFAVQLARNAGARVVGTCGPHNMGFVMALGAEAVIDYTRDDFREACRRIGFESGFDVVFDCVGEDTLIRSFDVVRPGGTVVGIVSRPPEEIIARSGARFEYVFVSPSSDQLASLCTLCEQGKLKPHVQKIYPLAEAAEAQRVMAQGHVRGKLVLAL